MGDDQFVVEVLKRAEEEMNRKEKNRRGGWTMERLVERACELTGVDKSELGKKGRRNTISFAKGLIGYWGCKELGYSSAEVARYLKISSTALAKLIKVGEKVAEEQKLKLIS